MANKKSKKNRPTKATQPIPQQDWAAAIQKIAKAAQVIGPQLKPVIEKMNEAKKTQRPPTTYSGMNPPTQRRRPLAPSEDNQEIRDRVEGLVEKLTRQPETVIEHVERVGGTIAVRKVYWYDDTPDPIATDQQHTEKGYRYGPLLCFVIPYDELARNESVYLAGGGEIGKTYGSRLDPAVDDVPTVGPVGFEKPQEPTEMGVAFQRAEALKKLGDLTRKPGEKPKHAIETGHDIGGNSTAEAAATFPQYQKNKQRHVCCKHCEPWGNGGVDGGTHAPHTSGCPVDSTPPDSKVEAEWDIDDEDDDDKDDDDEDLY